MNQLSSLFWTGIKESETQIPIKKGSISPSIKKNDFSFALTWTFAGHKVQYLGSRCLF